MWNLFIISMSLVWLLIILTVAELIMRNSKKIWLMQLYLFQVGPGCNHKGMFYSWSPDTHFQSNDIEMSGSLCRYMLVLRSVQLLCLSNLIQCVWRVIFSLLAKAAWFICSFHHSAEYTVQYSTMLMGIVCTVLPALY